METLEMVNRYGEPASHDDCLGQGGETACSGAMCWSENINTGNVHLRCARHDTEHMERQQAIHRDYLNDTVYSEA